VTFKELSDCNDIMLQEGPFARRFAALGLGAASLFGSPGSVHAKTPAPITHNIKQEQSLYDYIVQSEGKGKKGRPGYAYRDHKGYLTVGVGHLVTRNDPVLKRIAGKNYSAVISGRVPLNDSQMKQLFDYDVQSKIKLAKSKVRNFDSLPTAVQNAIVDGFFRGDLSGSPNTLELMNSGDFKAAAVEYLNNNEYRESKKERTGVAPRMERNAAAYSAYGSAPARHMFK
jgi:GH24 family phage-related lysozyme (muramidase)